MLPADIVIEPQGDIQLDEHGDIILTTDYNPSVSRRLSTPNGGYNRFILLGDTVQELDPEYKSGLSDFLSMPMSQIDSNSVSNTVIESLSKDANIDLTAVNVSLDNSSSVTVNLTYREKNNTQDINLTLPLA